MKFRSRRGLAIFLLLLLACCSDPGGVQETGRFQVDSQGIIRDRETGLSWAPDAGEGMTWHRAGQYAQNLRLGGFADWRLPTRAELKRLGPGGLNPAFKLAGNGAWSAEREDDSSAWEYHFREGREYWLFSNRHARVLAVRSPK